MENKSGAEVRSAQSREDWLIGRLQNVYANLQGLQMVMTRTAVMNMAETYLCIEDTTAYIAEKRDEKKDDFEEILEQVDPAMGEDDETDEENGRGGRTRRTER